MTSTAAEFNHNITLHNSVFGASVTGFIVFDDGRRGFWAVAMPLSGVPFDIGAIFHSNITSESSSRTSEFVTHNPFVHPLADELNPEIIIKNAKN